MCIVNHVWCCVVNSFVTMDCVLALPTAVIAIHLFLQPNLSFTTPRSTYCSYLILVLQSPGTLIVTQALNGCFISNMNPVIMKRREVDWRHWDVFISCQLYFPYYHLSACLLPLLLCLLILAVPMCNRKCSTHACVIHACAPTHAATFSIQILNRFFSLCDNKWKHWKQSPIKWNLKWKK